MNRVLTRTEFALLEALHAERQLNRQRTVAHGVVLHELSNSLMALLGAIEVLELRRTAGLSTDEIMDDMRRGGRHVRETLDSLRLLTGDRQEPARWEIGQLDAFLDEVVQECSGGIRVHVQVRGNCTRSFCPGLLRHVVVNLVRNALSHGDRTAPVRVNCREARAGGTWIHVLNRGPRIAADIIDRLFEPGRKNARGGMGLGLHIVRTCVERMGGELRFGTTGVATVFSVFFRELPVTNGGNHGTLEPNPASSVESWPGSPAGSHLGACCGA